MAQRNLTFSSVTICNTAVGNAGYVRTDDTPADLETKEYIKPGTAFSRVRVLGKAGSDGTRRTLAFGGWIYSTSMDGLETILSSIEAVRTNERRFIGQLTYGLLDGYFDSIPNCKMTQWRTGEIMQYQSGMFSMKFDCEFKQYGD